MKEPLGSVGVEPAPGSSSLPSTLGRSRGDGADHGLGLELLLAVSRELTRRQDARDGLARALGLLVPQLCQQAVLEITDPEAQRTLITAFSDPTLEQLAKEVGYHYPVAADAVPPDEPTLWEVTDALMTRVAHDPEHLAQLRRFGATEVFVVPLRRRGRHFGLLSLGTDQGRRFGEGDRLLIELLAQCFAAHIAGALLEDDIAQQRQRVDVEMLLLGVVSHDLRNPLGVVTMATSLLLAQDLTEAQRKLAKRIESAGRRSSRLISDLLDFTVARHGGIELSPEPRDLHGLVAQAVEDLHATWPDRSIIHERIGEATSQLDAARVEQIASNLIGNALQHSPAASVVRVETRGELEAVYFSVLNEGRPIPNDLIPKLFAPLSRGDNAGVRRGSIGLGLFIVHHLVLAHGGSIDVSSTETLGTRFTVRLPRAPRPRG
jgi:signal transduction histidine kinase